MFRILKRKSREPILNFALAGPSSIASTGSTYFLTLLGYPPRPPAWVLMNLMDKQQLLMSSHSISALKDFLLCPLNKA